MGGNCVNPEINEVFRILKARPRRVALTALKRDGGQFSQIDVVSRLDSSTEQVAIELTHVHLPKLEGAGYITWDRDAGTFSRGPKFDEIEPFIDFFDEHTEEIPCEWP